MQLYCSSALSCNTKQTHIEDMISRNTMKGLHSSQVTGVSPELQMMACPTLTWVQEDELLMRFGMVPTL